MPHESDSTEQVSAERLILDGIQLVVGAGLGPRRLTLPEGARVDVDGVSDDEGILVEVFAHQGALKGGQRHKIPTHILKLITSARGRTPAPRLILAFAEPKLAEWAAGASWLASAIATWGIEVLVVELDETIRDGIRAAQARQVMVNPPPAATDAL
jgi:hypothetical protein